MPTDPPESFQKTVQTAKVGNQIQNNKNVNCQGGCSLLPPLHLRLPLHQAAWLQDLASIITLAPPPSRDTTTTTSTTTSPRAHSTRPHTCHHRTRSPLRRGASEAEGSAALQLLSCPVGPLRGGHSLGSAPTATPQGLHSTSTPW